MPPGSPPPSPRGPGTGLAETCWTQTCEQDISYDAVLIVVYMKAVVLW